MNAPARLALTAVATLAAATTFSGLGTPAQATPRHHSHTGAVYVLSNQVAGNAVIAYQRADDGTLRAAGEYPTGGLGTGTGLGSQDAIVVEGNHVYAVNAGSDSISSFAIRPDGLRLLSTVPSGGEEPISVSVRANRLYALNAGGDGNVSGFRVDHGRLAPLTGSTRALSGSDVAPAQVAISPDGEELVVTEKGTSLIDVYRLNGRGVATGLVSAPSSGATPFGFDFTPSGRLAVSEAGPSAASSYAVNRAGLRTISASVANTEAAACWLVVTANGRYAYTGNGGGSQSISGYRVAGNSSLSLLDADGQTATAAGGVSDLALSARSDFLYARLGDGTVGSYAVNRDGSLSSLAPVGGLPAGAAGIAAR